MSWSERSVQHHKRQTDCAIHHAFRLLAAYPSALDKFHELLSCARLRAPRLFQAPVVDGRHLGVDALVHLARFHAVHLRPVSDWPGTASSWRPVVASLAHHLVCEYRVPAFLASAWYANDSTADTKRHWFVQHSRGFSFRSLKPSIAMTRKMEHIFLASADHLSIDHALRRSELLALGMPHAFLEAILSTRLATDLSHGDFWRTVWQFLIANADEVDPEQIGPMIDYIHEVRHECRSGETLGGLTTFAPLLPNFSMKGRTVKSVLRLMQTWHHSLAGVSEGLSWSRSSLRPLLFEEPRLTPSDIPRSWHMMELTTSAQLRNEGAALHHCVASYALRCTLGTSRIWSLRLSRGEKLRSVLTVEVDPKRRAVVQARGFCNRMPAGKPRRLLNYWADREQLRMAI